MLVRDIVLKYTDSNPAIFQWIYAIPFDNFCFSTHRMNAEINPIQIQTLEILHLTSELQKKHEIWFTACVDQEKHPHPNQTLSVRFYKCTYWVVLVKSGEEVNEAESDPKKEK